jgi:fucose permease
MKKTKNMLKLTNKQSIMPLALTTILFFLWGFAYGLLDVLNSQFQLIVHMTPGQEVGLHSAYFSGYFIGPLTTGRFILKKYGFKATFICGLVIYGCGTLVFWPSAVLTSFTAFLISNLIVGTGLATLETAANPFIVLCGPPEYGEIRLNISQGFQAIGSILSPLLAQKVFFKNLHDAPSLISVQWAYLGIALFVILLAVVFYYLPIPGATDEELDELADKRRIINQTKVLGVEVVWITLGLAIFSQFCYVGGQEAVAGQFQLLVEAVKPQ